MERVRFGTTELEVPPLCLGAMNFGTPNWGCDAAAAADIVRVYRDAGGTFFDTANIYGGGESERILGALVAELGGENDLVPPAPDRLPHQALVGEGPVHVGGVEEGDAEVEGAVDGRDGLLVVAPGVEVAHPHAAQAEGGDGEAGGAEGSRWNLDHMPSGLGWSVAGD